MGMGHRGSQTMLRASSTGALLLGHSMAMTDFAMLPPKGGATGSTSKALPGVLEQGLRQFLCPSTLENPDVVGRLELFAEYGPTDDDGFLRGGVGGRRSHTDLEI